MKTPCLLALALLVALLPACPEGGDSPSEPGPPVPEVSEESEAIPEPPPPDAVDPFDPGEFTWLTPEVKAKLLALPSLAARSEGETPMFRLTGEMTVREESFGANDSMTLLIAVEAEQRSEPDREFSPLTIYVRAVVNFDGEVQDARCVRTETAEDIELYELLGVER